MDFKMIRPLPPVFYCCFMVKLILPFNLKIMSLEKPRDDEPSEAETESRKTRKPLNPHYLAVAMGQANMTHARALAAIMEDKKNNPDADE